MITEIRIYIEGFKDKIQIPESKNPNFKSKIISQGKIASLRIGFQGFFKDIKEMTESKNIALEIIMCGGRKSAYNDFVKALEDHDNAFNILLIDSEGKISQEDRIWEYLETKKEDQWQSLNLTDEHCHLMVQVMEAWFIADINALKQFYQKGFKEDKIKRGMNNYQSIEQVSKETIDVWLRSATRHSVKGKYHKTQHAPKLLELLNVNQVRNSCYYCDRLFKTLIYIIDLSN
jgi:hypothetical protein